MDAHAICAPDRDGGIRHIQHQTSAIFDGATVIIRPFVCAILQKLIEQIAVRAVQFHAIKSGTLGVYCTFSIGLNDARDFVPFQGPGRDVWLHRAEQTDMSSRSNSARSHGHRSIQIVRI